MSDTDDTMAIISLVCAIAGFMAMPLILSVMAIVFGKMQLDKIEGDPLRYGGKQFAQIGFWIGIIRGGIIAFTLLITLVMVGFMFLLPFLILLIAGAS